MEGRLQMVKTAEQAFDNVKGPPAGPGSNASKRLADFIVDGDIRIETVEAFGCVLKQFPENAGLHKMHADLLLEKNLRYAAAKSYARAADLFIRTGSILPAVSAKISQWQIIPSSDEENHQFLAQIKNGAFPQSPLRSFFSRLSDDELMAFFSCLERSQFPTGATIKAPNEKEQDLFLVVFGKLRECYDPAAEVPDHARRSSAVILGGEDCFGDIYPFTETRVSHSYIEAVSPVELFRLPRERLRRLCRHHKNIEIGLVELCKVRTESGAEGLSRMIRECRRYENLNKVSLELYPTATEGYPLTLSAYARDISIGGVRLVLDCEAAVTSTLISSYRKTLLNTRARIGLPGDKLSLKIAGRVAWCRPVCMHQERTLAVGIRFEDMSPKLRGMFFGFVEGFGQNGTAPSAAVTDPLCGDI